MDRMSMNPHHAPRLSGRRRLRCCRCRDAAPSLSRRSSPQISTSVPRLAIAASPAPPSKPPSPASARHRRSRAAPDLRELPAQHARHHRLSRHLSTASPTPSSSPATSTPCGCATPPRRSGPTCRFAREDKQLASLIEGVIRRQAAASCSIPTPTPSCARPRDKPLSWAVHDQTDMKPGVGERKWEVDSLCYPMRLAHGYWKATGSTAPSMTSWRDAAHRIVKTFREQQRKHDRGPTTSSAARPCPPTPCPFAATAIPRGPSA